MKKIIIMTVFVFLLTGCGGSKKDKPAIKIGKIEITAEEFDNAFKSSKFTQGREELRREFLDTFISRTLLLNEAEKLGLDKDPEFLQSIQLFWNQSLLKLILARKMNELSAKVKVSDREIKDFYEKYREEDYSGRKLPEIYEQIKWILFKEKQRKAIQQWTDSLRNNIKIEKNYELLKIKNK